MVGIELRSRSKRVASHTEVKDLKFKDLKFKDFRSHSTMQVFIKTLSRLNKWESGCQTLQFSPQRTKFLWKHDFVSYDAKLHSLGKYADLWLCIGIAQIEM